VQKFTSQGTFVTQWGGYEVGEAPGKFYGPRDIAVSAGGQVLVTDTGNKRIQVFDQNGTFLRAFGSEGSGPGQFKEPVGLAVDRQGRIYVADTWNQRIQVFDSSFQQVGQYEVPGWGSQAVSNKPYLAVGPDGDVYATLPERRSVVQVKDGAVRTVPLPASPALGLPTGVDVMPDGALVVSDPQNAVVVGYDLAAGGAARPDSDSQPN